MTKLIIIAAAAVAWCWYRTSVRCTVVALLLLAIHPVLLVVAFVAAVLYMRSPLADAATPRAVDA